MTGQTDNATTARGPNQGLPRYAAQNENSETVTSSVPRNRVLYQNAAQSRSALSHCSTLTVDQSQQPISTPARPVAPGAGRRRHTTAATMPQNTANPAYTSEC